MEPLWYVINARGLLTLCAGENDARTSAADFDLQWPKMAPHRAVQMIEYTPAAAPSAPAPAEVPMPEPDGFSVMGMFTVSRGTAANFSKGADAPVREWISPQRALAYAAAREAAERERVIAVYEKHAREMMPAIGAIRGTLLDLLAAARAELGDEAETARRREKEKLMGGIL